MNKNRVDEINDVNNVHIGDVNNYSMDKKIACENKEWKYVPKWVEVGLFSIFASVWVYIAYASVISHSYMGGQSVILKLMAFGFVLFGIYWLIYFSGKFMIYFEHKNNKLIVGAKEYDLANVHMVYHNGRRLRLTYKTENKDSSIYMTNDAVEKVFNCLTS